MTDSPADPNLTQLSLTDSPEEQASISLSSNTDRTGPLPQPVIDQRAVKASVATGMPVDALQTAFTSPQAEEMLRNSVSQQQALDNRSKQMDLIGSMAKDGPMTEERAQLVQTLTDPNLIGFDKNAMEGLFAKNAMQLSYANLGTQKYAQATNEDPDKVDGFHRAAEGTTKVMGHINQKAQDKADWSTYGGPLGYAYYFAKGMIPLESTYAKFDKYEDNLMPGANMKSQIQHMWSMDPNDAIKWIDKRYDEIAATNPIDANDWLTSLTSYGSFEMAASTFSAGVDIASSLPIGKLIKGSGKVVEDVTKGVVDSAKVKEWKAASEASVKAGDGPAPLPEGWSEAYVHPDTGETVYTKRPATDLAEGDARSKYLSDSGWSSKEEPSAIDQAGKGMTDTARVLSQPKIDPVHALEGTGNTEAAAKLNVTQQIAAKTEATTDADLSFIQKKLISIFNPASFLKDSKNLSREMTDRILNTMASADSNLNKILTNTQQVTRLSQEALQAGYEKARASLADRFYQTSDHVQDISWRLVPQEETASHLNLAEVTLGEADGSSFESYERAKQVAENKLGMTEGSYSIGQDGKAYTIKVSKAIDETDSSVTKLMINTRNTTPRSFANTLLGRFRSPEDLLSQTQRDARSVASPVTQETQRLFSAAISPTTKKLTKAQYNRLDAVMKVNRDFESGGERGKWFETAREFENSYYSVHKQWPTPQETEAYAVTRQLSDFDWAVRSLSILKDKQYQGLERIRLDVPVSGETLEEGGSGLVNKTFEFDGKKLETLPTHRGGYDPGVSVISEPFDISGKSKWSRLSKVDRPEIERLMKEEGYHLFQAGSERDLPFKDYNHIPENMREANSSFYLIKGAQRNTLAVSDQLPYKAGYHVEYPPGFYTKVPKFRTAVDGVKEYIGDHSIFHHDSQAQAEKYSGNMETARQLYNDNKTDELKTFLNKNLPHSYAEFGKLYGATGLDSKTPFFYTKTGQTVKDAARTQNGDLHSVFKGVSDPSESEYNLMNYVDRHFAQEKNIELPSVQEGSEGKPAFKFGASQNISPLSTLNRAVHEMTRLRVLDDYVKQATQSLIEEFANPESLGGSVTRRSYDSIRRNPVSFLTDPLWDEKVLSRDKLGAAKNSYRALTQLLSNSSDLSRSIDFLNNKVLNLTFNKFGDEATSKVADFLQTRVKDPTQYMRGFAFHAKLGVFNPIQMWLQGQTLVHAAAVTGNPARSYKALAMSGWQRTLSLTDNPGIIDHAASKAAFFGVDKEQFKEAHDLMRKSGIWNVEGDHASIDDMLTAPLWSGKGKQMLDKGTVFFKETERFVRMNAFNTAYLEWTAKNAGKKLSDDPRAFATVLTRYDDLALNMTRKSTASFQKGIFSLPTQFSTYSIHMAEQMLGKRLTMAEKTRALSTYAMLYGIPAGITAALPVVDWGEDIKEAAMARGIDTNSGVLNTMLHGVISQALEFATGKQTNIGERSGPTTLSPLSGLESGQKGIAETIGGPSVSTTSDFLTAVAHAASPALYAVFRSNPALGNDDFPLHPEDFLAVLKNISTVNNGYKLYTAANFGTYMNKYGQKVMDNADALDGAISNITGADPRAISDRFSHKTILKEITDGKLAHNEEITLNLNRAYQSFDDPVAMAKYLTRAKIAAVAAGINDKDYSNLVEQASKTANVSMVDQANKAWAKQFPPNFPVANPNDQGQ